MINSALEIANDYMELLCQQPAAGELKVNYGIDRWTARSGLQKAIRRGLLQPALTCAAALINEDASYFWRSLNVIALEDIGPADPTIVITSRVLMGDKGPIKRHGIKAITNLIKAMCDATKSRALCEIEVAARFGHPQLFQQFRDCAHDVLLAIYCNGSEVEMCAAGMTLAHKAPQEIGNRLESAAEGREHMLAFAGSASPLALACQVAIDKPTDTMGYALWPMLVNQDKWFDYTVDYDTSFDDQPTLKYGLPAATWDMHTRPGKTALKAFYTSLVKYPDSPFRHIDPKEAVRAIGAVVFVEEGGLISNRIHTDYLDSLKYEQDKALCIGYGLPKCIWPEAREYVRENLELLNSKRQWALSL